MFRSELLKLSTTNTWWWFALGALAWTGIALAFNIWLAATALDDPAMFGTEGDYANPVYHAGNIYTSGQFLGLMFVMLIGIVMVASEYHHQTATTTYLTTPHRTTVILSKSVTAVLIAFVFWAITSAIAIGVGALFFAGRPEGLLLGDSEVQRTIWLNLAAYLVWAIFGIAIGTLITNLLAATITAALAYLIGTQLVSLAFMLLSMLLENETVLEFQVLVPSIASQVMTTGGEGVPGTPAWWVGALVLLAYTVVAGAIGVVINRKRDIS
ncbi:ABC transporter permease [Natronosporangium hydrolyticum]|uniref:ABC transporter permease n=1 Tax=Natronosporangium hydrolyticum TaxID=2811111 RepID=A0A895YSV8_9ACTN|nr:ABC transporter permease [Natronosporangium hydrolyticum]